MSKDLFGDNDINNLLNEAFKNEPTVLRRMFERKLKDLDISFNQAKENLEISYRALNGILDGTLDQLEFLSLLKIAQFLEISYDKIVLLYTEAISSKNKESLAQSEKRTFILNNFDLPILKNIGVIDSIRDFDHIEYRLNEILGLKRITDYNADDFEVAFSSGKKVPKDLRTRKYFVRKARAVLELINNPNPYKAEALLDYIPKIRWQSIDFENGLVNVVRSLYKLGVTVIFQPKMPALQLRGATFVVNEKPGIVLTDYRGYYPTLWFALLHEIFHVVFDWQEILEKKYHLSDEEDDLEVVRQRENEANDFAQSYMFPKNKLEEIKDKIDNRLFIRGYALDNHVHPSIVYANYAYDSNSEENYWQLFNKAKLFPPLEPLLRKLGNGFTHQDKALNFAAYYKTNIFNIQ